MNDTKQKEKTEKPYKKEQYIQIYIPLIVFAFISILLVAGVIFVSGNQAQSISHWGNISAVIIIFPLFFELLLVLLLLVLLIIGFAKLIKWVPIHLSNLYVLIIKAAIFVMNISNKITSPIINSRAKFYSFQYIFKKGTSK